MNPAQIKLRLDLELLARLRHEVLLPLRAVLRGTAEQDVLTQMHLRAAPLQPPAEEDDARKDDRRANEEVEAQRGAAHRLLLDAQHDDARKDDEEHHRLRLGDPPQRLDERPIAVELIEPEIFQHQWTRHQCDDHHPVGILKLRIKRGGVKPDAIVENVIPQRMRQIDRECQQHSIDELQKLVVEILLTREHGETFSPLSSDKVA
jgi:hypothetical protein